MTEPKGSPSFVNSLPLNKTQKEAVIYNDGPQLVFAGAGTGKTRVLTAKIAFLIRECGYFPNHIFAATFTNKAAQAMRDKVENLINSSCKGLWIGTFHSLCARILRAESEKLGYKNSFTIYDRTDQLSLIKKVMKELYIDECSIQPKSLLSKISQFKNDCRSYNYVKEKAENFYDQQMVDVYGLYQKKLLESGAMDFDDLITNTVFLFRKEKNILNHYRMRFKYILVDEYQDTNTSQFFLVSMLAQEHHKIFVVGDDDQSIYSWRGARIENILSFENKFPGTKVFKLEENYRSPQSVLDFANAVIKSNTNRANKKLWTSQTLDSDVIVARYSDDRHEAESVVEKIKELFKKNINPGDIAILFRTNAQSRSFEDSFRKHKIKYIIVGGTGFYERKEIKDCLAYMRLLVNPNDNISCERIINVPPRGVGKKTLEKLWDIAKEEGKPLLDIITSHRYEDLNSRAENGLKDLEKLFNSLNDKCRNSTPPQEILEEVLSETGYIEMLVNDDTVESNGRLENISELLNAITRWHDEEPEKSLSDFLEETSLATDVDRWDQKDEAVNLMTFHSAKGLEFRAVFLVGIEDGLIPSRQNFYDDDSMEEECRLLYVGATRAMKFLECSYTDMRMRFGSLMQMEPSRFLMYVSPKLYRFIDQSAVTYTNKQTSTVKIKNRKSDSAKKTFYQEKVFDTKQIAGYDGFSQETVEFRIGQVVMQEKYGRGKITSINGFGPDMQLTILFDKGIRKRMMAKFAKLKTL